MALQRVKDIKTTILSEVNALRANQGNDQNSPCDNGLVGDLDKINKFLKFIAELLMILGIDLVKDINNFLAKLREHEPMFKQILLCCLNKNITCNMDDVFKFSEVYPNPYFLVNIKKFDFFGQFKIDPNSKAGLFLYSDPIENNLNKAIKLAIDSNTEQNWNDMLVISYDRTTNYITFYIHQSWLGKPISSFVIKIFDKINFIPKKINIIPFLFDNLYGSFSTSIQPTRIDPLSLINKQVLNKYIEKVLDGGDDLIIDDSFFNFSNDELFDMEKMAQNLSKNYLEIISCNNAETVIRPEDVFSVLDDLVNAGTFIEQLTVIEAGMTKLETIASRNIARIDLPKFRFEYYLNIFKEITNVLVSLVYSPQFLFIMMMHLRMADPNTAGSEPLAYDDFKDFLKKTKNLFRCITNANFKFVFVNVIMVLIIKKLTTEANQERYKRNKEKYDLFVQQYLSIKGFLDVIKNKELLSAISSGI